MPKPIKEVIVIKIQVSLKGRYKNATAVATFFKMHAEYLRKLMRKMSKEIGFKLPRLIILRPFYWKKTLTYYHGRVIWECINGVEKFQILLAYEHLINKPDKGKEVLIHEACHVAEMKKHRKMTHGKEWQKMFANYKKEVDNGGA